MRKCRITPLVPPPDHFSRPSVLLRTLVLVRAPGSATDGRAIYRGIGVGWRIVGSYVTKPISLSLRLMPSIQLTTPKPCLVMSHPFSPSELFVHTSQETPSIFLKVEFSTVSSSDPSQGDIDIVLKHMESNLANRWSGRPEGSASLIPFYPI